jgi:hypothetical protein
MKSMLSQSRETSQVQCPQALIDVFFSGVSLWWWSLQMFQSVLTLDSLQRDVECTPPEDWRQQPSFPAVEEMVSLWLDPSQNSCCRGEGGTQGLSEDWASLGVISYCAQWLFLLTSILFRASLFLKLSWVRVSLSLPESREAPCLQTYDWGTEGLGILRSPSGSPGTDGPFLWISNWWRGANWSPDYWMILRKARVSMSHVTHMSYYLEWRIRLKLTSRESSDSTLISTLTVPFDLGWNRAIS